MMCNTHNYFVLVLEIKKDLNLHVYHLLYHLPVEQIAAKCHMYR